MSAAAQGRKASVNAIILTGANQLTDFREVMTAFLGKALQHSHRALFRAPEQTINEYTKDSCSQRDDGRGFRNTCEIRRRRTTQRVPEIGPCGRKVQVLYKEHVFADGQ